MQKEKLKEFINKAGKMRLVGAASAALLVAVIVLGMLLGNGGNNENVPDNTSKETESVTDTDSHTEESNMPTITQPSDETESTDVLPETPKDMKVNAVAEINELIAMYYQAKKDCDAVTLMRLIYPAGQITEEGLKSEAYLVEGYENIVCYTIEGLTADSYAVLVSYEYKFYGIETMAPALNIMYVRRSSESGEYQICGLIDEETAAYLTEIAGREDVMELTDDTESRLSEALQKDTALLEFYNKLNGGSGNAQ